MIDSAMVGRWLHAAFGGKDSLSRDDLLSIVLSMRADKDGPWTFAPAGAVPEAHCMIARTLSKYSKALPRNERLAALEQLAAFARASLDLVDATTTTHTPARISKKRPSDESQELSAKKVKTDDDGQGAESALPPKVSASALPTMKDDASGPSPVASRVETAWLFTEHRLGDDMEAPTPSERFFNGEVGGFIFMCDPQTKRPIEDERYPLRMDVDTARTGFQAVRGLLPRCDQALSMVNSYLDTLTALNIAVPQLYGPLAVAIELVLFVLKHAVGWHAGMSDEDRDVKLRAILAEKDPERSLDNVVQQRHELGFVWVPAPQATTTNDANAAPPGLGRCRGRSH
ncbi:hypothetical protein SDRG_06550 [Saprolegnia diclina VS20]|uniref:Uncharacterized protein n=1 Tax=Saprolegnia diclina (strain VS20) TaxID=1156394 RepID=T0QM47_SAPDV|nr:hypothetical protein SDRG_06550 [Saprolegnia diclina VS20]EQC35791.1 hypothetical protein SDRG_06550 [Saprolegnia diclina VS20]|eukprot:XP_008610553.1 hypothetical protein SDRG_06550 [Saprolegnia diclina VS20]